MEKQTGSIFQNIRALLKPQFVIFYVIIALYSFAGQMLTSPVTTFGLSFGLSGLALGLIQNGCEFTCMVGRPLAGYLMDRSKKKPVLLFSFALLIASSLFYAISSSPAAYTAARLFQGFVTAFVSAVMASLLPSIVPESQLGTGMAISTALMTLGTAYAPAVSKTLFTVHGFQVAYLAAAAVASVILLVVLLLRIREGGAPAAAERVEKEPFRLRHLISGIAPQLFPVCTIGLFVNITKDVNDFYIIQLGIDQGIDVTTGIAIAGTLAVFIGVGAGLLIDKFRPGGVLVPAFIALAFSNFLYANATTTAMAIAAALLYRIGIGCYWPALLVQCCYVLPQRRATAIATVYFFLDIVSLLNNTLLGWLYDRIGAAEMYIFAGIVNIGSIAYYVLLRKFYLRKRETPFLGG